MADLMEGMVLHSNHLTRRSSCGSLSSSLICVNLSGWNQGCRSAQQMYREIKEQGYTGSSTAVGRFVAPFRAHKGKARSFKSVEPELATMVNPEEVKKKRPPTALQIAHWMTFKEEQRLEWQQSYLTQLCEKDSQIAQTYELIQEFTSMLREREGERLDEWLERVENQGLGELQSS